jgi:hypothetical protein
VQTYTVAFLRRLFLERERSFIAASVAFFPLARPAASLWNVLG